jgi:hypothetical protein
MTLATIPSDVLDPRNALPRSPHCPGGCGGPKATACVDCAWGFYTPEGPGIGEVVMQPLIALSVGYKSQCGRVALHRDQDGRIGALRGGKFFPGITSNSAYERYIAGLEIA